MGIREENTHFKHAPRAFVLTNVPEIFVRKIVTFSYTLEHLTDEKKVKGGLRNMSDI